MEEGSGGVAVQRDLALVVARAHCGAAGDALAAGDDLAAHEALSAALALLREHRAAHRLQEQISGELQARPARLCPCCRAPWLAPENLAGVCSVDKSR